MIVRQQLTAFEMGGQNATVEIVATSVVSNWQTVVQRLVSGTTVYQTENAGRNCDPILMPAVPSTSPLIGRLPSHGNPYPGDNGYQGRDLTGTYRIAASQSDDARRAVDDATRNLSLAERQRIYDSLLRRLDPPQMLALDRRGNAVTIASTRAPQISFTLMVVSRLRPRKTVEPYGFVLNSPVTS